MSVSDNQQSTSEVDNVDEGIVESNESIDESQKKKKKKKKIHKLSLEETEDFNAKLRKRGVIYISRIPPRMGPAKAKALLGEFGVVTRIYLEEEDKAARKMTNRNGGFGYQLFWSPDSKKIAFIEFRHPIC